MLRVLQSQNIVQYYDDNPADVGAIVTAVTHRTLLSTPAPTPRDDAISTPLPSQHSAQVYENKLRNADEHADEHTAHARQPPCVDGPHETSLSNPDHRGPLAVEDGVENGRHQYQSYCEDAEESEMEQTGGIFLPLGNLEDSAPADTSSSPEDSIAQRDSRPSRQAAQAAATFILQQLDIAPYRPRKRKRAPKRAKASNCDQTEDTTDAELESLSPEASEYCDPPSPPGGDDNSHKELHPPESMPPAECHGDFAILDEGLRAKVRMIADGETLENLWHVVNYMEAQSSPLARCSGARSYPLPEASTTSVLDERARVLGDKLIQEEEKEGQIKCVSLLNQISKRVYLAELIGMYIEETQARKAEPQRKRRKTARRQSVKDRFTDLLFPQTIEWKNMRLSETEQGKQNEESLRKKAKQKLEYWIRLGEPLAMMARRHGVGSLAVLPQQLIDSE